MIWAHPRSRGENINCTSHVVFSHGSSPLTRGKPLGRIRDARPMGLIPAHAGKTQRSSRCPERAIGSSPLTRGKLREIAQLHEGGGLIPAHAGKPCLPRRRCISHGAHPRSRGENRCSGAGGRSSSGSSPLTRGKRHHPVLQRVRGRLIPAHAGKTSSGACRTRPLGAHPRSRGENLLCVS